MPDFSNCGYVRECPFYQKYTHWNVYEKEVIMSVSYYFQMGFTQASFLAV